MENIIAIHGRTLSDHSTASGSASASTGRDMGGAPVPLRLAQEGECVRIVSLNGGKGFYDRLAGVGLRIGARLEIIQNRMDGKLLVGHEGIRLFLGGGMAQKIQVVIVEGRSK
jgi:ferrous iron transport protein A